MSPAIKICQDGIMTRYDSSAGELTINADTAEEGVMQIDPVISREVDAGIELLCPKCKNQEWQPLEHEGFEKFKVWTERHASQEIHTQCLECDNKHVARTSSAAY